jgi:hypothetical protein
MGILQQLSLKSLENHPAAVSIHYMRLQAIGVDGSVAASAFISTDPSELPTSRLLDNVVGVRLKT